MENTLKKILIREDAPEHPSVQAVREICQRMDLVQNRFTMETDPDLIEGCVYEMEALRAQYRYWLRKARAAGLTCQERTYLWNE